MPSLSITQQHIASAAGAHNGVVGEESGEVCVCVRVFREGSGGWGLCGGDGGKTRGGDISREMLISVGD